MEKTLPTGKGRQRVLFVDSWRPRGVSLLVPVMVTISVLIFIVTMYVNDCPKHAESCAVGFLGRLSFQPVNENPLLGPSSSTLLKMGAISTDKVARDHQVWRLFTCIWLHAGLIHLFVDLLSLLFVGIRLEQEFGPWRIGSLYFLSGIGGSLMAEIFLQHRVSVGASASLFGLLGATLSELFTNWSNYTMKGQTLAALILLAIVNLVIGIFPHADNIAHIGGFLFGFLLGFIFLMRPHSAWGSEIITPPSERPGHTFISKYAIYQILLLGAAALLLGVGYILLMVLAFRGVDANESCRWCHYLSCMPSSWWRCDNRTEGATCKYVISGSYMFMTCESNQMTQLYYGFYSASTMRQLCAKLCS